MRPIIACFSQRLEALRVQAETKVGDITALSQKIESFLPEEFRQDCWVGSFTQGILVLKTSKPNLAHELRFYLPELRDRLRKEANLYQLLSLKITIHNERSSIKEATPPLPVKKDRAHLSALAQKSIEAAAHACGYEPLKASLLRLADKEH